MLLHVNFDIISEFLVAWLFYFKGIKSLYLWWMSALNYKNELRKINVKTSRYL
jgi:hypothetical protein